MESTTKILKRILTVQSLAFKEAIRRKMLILLSVFSLLFLLAGGLGTRGCIAIIGGGLEQQRSMNVEKINEAPQLSPEQKKAQLALLDKRFAAIKKEQGKSAVSIFGAVTYTMVAFWLFLVAGIFTPFLAMNDFQNRTHVMILARPVERWQYLVGRYLAIIGMLAINLAIMLLISYGFLWAFSPNLDARLLKSISLFATAILTFTVMQMFFSMVLGRIPSLFLGIVIVGLGIMPAFALLRATTDQLATHWQIYVYSAGYGLPQYATNFLYGLTEIAPDFGPLKSLRKVGNNTGPLSPWINLGWFLVFWAGSILVLNKQEIET